MHSKGFKPATQKNTCCCWSRASIGHLDQCDTVPQPHLRVTRGPPHSADIIWYDNMGATKPLSHPLPASFCRHVTSTQHGWLDKNPRPRPGTVAHACNHFGRPRRVDQLSGVWDRPGQHDKTSSLLKIQKLARHGGVCL